MIADLFKLLGYALLAVLVTSLVFLMLPLIFVALLTGVVAQIFGVPLTVTKDDKEIGKLIRFKFIPKK